MADRVSVLSQGRIVQTGAPEDLYRRPQSRFVAEFLGETNLIPARIGIRTPEGLQVETPAGRLQTTSGYANPAQDILCSIRPEALRLAPAAPDGPAPQRASAPNSLRGRILDTTYLGELAQYTVELPGEIQVKAADLNPLAARSRAGEPVTLTVAPEDIVVLPA